MLLTLRSPIALFDAVPDWWEPDQVQYAPLSSKAHLSALGSAHAENRPEFCRQIYVGRSIAE